MIGKIIVLIVVAVVAYGIYYIASEFWCAENYNSVFSGKVVDKQPAAVSMGFGAGSVSMCVVQLTPGHYENFKDINVTKTFASSDSESSCQYQVGDKVVVRAETSSFAKIVAEDNGKLKIDNIKSIDDLPAICRGYYK